MKRDLLLLLALGALCTPACNSGVDDGGTGGTDGSGARASGANAIGTGGGASGGGTSGAGATAGTGASSGSGGGDSGGTGGGAPACTPGTGTEDVGTDSLLDKVTCLTWQKASTIASPTTGRAALTHCNELTQDGLSWRLATAAELRTYPNLATSNFAYMAGPTFRPSSAPDDATGCATDTHTCNLALYSVGNYSCAWQGPGQNAYPVLCVSGEAAAGTLDPAFDAATCCSASSTFQPGDCSL